MVDNNDVVMYVGDSIRALREGTLIARSRKIINFGRVSPKNSDPSLCHIMALCLTSSINAKPHEINISLKLNNDDFGAEIVYAKCSCVANSSKCKHIVGILFRLVTLSCTDMEQLPRLGCTDLKQSWGKYAEKALEDLKCTPVSNFQCCVHPLQRNFGIPDEIDEDLKQLVFSKLMTSFSDSILAISYASNDCLPPSTSQCDDNSKENLISLEDIFSYGSQNENNCFLNDIQVLMLESSGTQQEINFYNSVVKIDMNRAKEIFEDSRGQASNQVWKKQRQIRITGTATRPLYTFYTTSDKTIQQWERKISTTVFPTFKGNSATKFGNAHEKVALELYAKALCEGEKLYLNNGFVINAMHPWLGFSPDGFLQKGDDLILLEVKCPERGEKIEDPERFLQQLTYLELNDTFSNKSMLKQKTTYFGQIMLGLAICNLKEAKLLIYYKNKDMVVEFSVQRDDDHCRELISKLGEVYFKYFLPFIASDMYNNYFVRNHL